MCPIKNMHRLALLGISVLIACSALPGGCPARQPSIAAYKQFKDLEARANATPKIALSPIVEEMQAARNEIGQLDPHVCEQEVVRAHSSLIEWMDADITVFSAVMNNDITDDPLLKSYVQNALSKQSLAGVEIDRISNH